MPTDEEHNAALIAQRDALTTANVKAMEDFKAAHEADMQSLRDRIAQLEEEATTTAEEHAEEIAALKGQAPPSTQRTINALSTAYKTQISEEYQGLPALLDIFANVGRLIELGEPEMARARILNAEVPQELEALKPAFAAMIPTE